MKEDVFRKSERRGLIEETVWKGRMRGRCIKMRCWCLERSSRHALRGSQQMKEVAWFPGSSRLEHSSPEVGGFSTNRLFFNRLKKVAAVLYILR